MRVVKSILRWFFALQAVGFLVAAVFIVSMVVSLRSQGSTQGSFVDTHHLLGPIAVWAMVAFFVALGPIFAAAWWITRTPRAKPSPWAIVASGFNVFLGVLFIWGSRFSPSHIKSSPTGGFWCLAFGLAGLFVFSRRELQPDPALAKPKAASVAGDRTSIWTRHAVTALSTVAQIAAIFFWTGWAFTQHLPVRHALSWIVLVTAACIVTTVIHECGHAILAWCFEMKLLSFKAGPFQWARREGKWAFKFHAAGLITPGGSISAAPTRPDQPAWEFILMIAAGPGANLLIGAAAVWAVIHDRWGTYQQTWEFIAYTGAFCLIGAVLNLIPFLSEEGSYSDGARMLQILTRSQLLVASPALAPASVAIATPKPLSVAPPVLVPAPFVAAAPELAPTSLALTPPLTMPAPSLPQILAAAAPPSPPPPVPARSTLTPGTVRPVDVVTLAAAKVEHAPAPVQPALAVIPVEAAASESAPDIDDLLAARLASFLARPTPSPVASAPDPKAVVRILAPQVPATPGAAVSQESLPKNAPQINVPAVESLPDLFGRIAAAPAADAPASPPPSAASVAAAPGFTPSGAFTAPITAMAPNPLVGTSFTPDLSPAESSSTGRIASVTRIPASALNTTPTPPAIRLPAASESATGSAPTAPTGPKAPAVPSAFARRSRPAPLPSGSPAIEDILAEAAATLDELPSAASLEVEEPVFAASCASANLPPTPFPAATPSATVSESAPLGPTFSESWPPRRAAMPPAPARSESLDATPAASASDPKPSRGKPAGGVATDETPLPTPQSETSRFDPFDFLRSAAIESLNANPG
jgi:Peptidase family M50